MAGQTRWATSGDAQVAYRREGRGPTVLALLGTMGGLVLAEEPPGRRFAAAITRFAELIAYDPRGTGSSDPLPTDRPLTVEDQVADVLAILDDADVDEVVLHGFHAGVATAIATAVTAPDRVVGLVLANGWPRALVADDYPLGMTVEASEAMIDAHRRQFGTGMFVDAFCPSRAGDPMIREIMARVEQRGSSRAQATILTRFAQELDVRDRLASVAVPTLVLHTEGDVVVPLDSGRYLADQIPGARLVVLPGVDHAFHLVDPSRALEELERFVTGELPEHAPERSLVALLFTDIVGSTVRAAELGDRRWRELLDQHDVLVRKELDEFGGHEVGTAGDGFVVTFSRPATAIACAQAIGRALATIGLDVRAGVHLGEVELRETDIGGLTVHTGARIAALAGAGEVLVSRTVVDVLAGSPLVFELHGVHELKGVPRTWEVYRVAAS